MQEYSGPCEIEDIYSTPNKAEHLDRMIGLTSNTHVALDKICAAEVVGSKLYVYLDSKYFEATYKSSSYAMDALSDLLDKINKYSEQQNKAH